MNWPSSSDFSDAMQHPERWLKDANLRKCKAEKNKMGVPRARSGAFANVYKLVNGNLATAVRVFLYPNPEREERYRILHDSFLRGRPKCLVDFSYQPEGIKVKGKWYPIQTMHWVNGLTLGQWMNEKVTKREVPLLRKMADRWVDLVEELRTFKIAHGDLQHGNVMVVNDTPCLVDYDCMCVAPLVGRHAFEKGMPAYQHPQRGGQALTLELDHFSAWIILIAMRAVAHDLSLWKRYVEDTKNESLLFTESDIKEPDKSPLWKDLLASTETDVKLWSAQLLATIPQPFDRIPPFEFDVFGALRKACQTKKWEEIWAAATNASHARRPLPRDLHALVDEARKRVECRDRLKTAVDARDVRTAAATYKSGHQLLDDWAATASLVAQGKKACEVVDILDLLQAERKNPGSGQKLIDLWNRHAVSVVGLAEGDTIRKDVEEWTRRITLRDRFLDAVQKGLSEQAIADAWAQLQAAGGHADAHKHSSRAKSAVQRMACLRTLRTLPADITEDTDRQLANVWDETILKDCVEADPFRQRYQAGIARRQALEALKTAIAAADAVSDQAHEQAVIAASGKLPAGYAPKLSKRIQDASARINATGELAAALAGNPVSDTRIAEAFERAQRTGAMPTDTATLDRCKLAVRRREGVRKVQAIDASLPVHEQDARWLRDWEEGLLQPCSDAAPLRTRFVQARERTQAWNKLEEALAAKDATHVKSLSASRLLAGYPPLQKRLAEINDLIQLTNQIDSVIAAVQSGDDAALFSALDYRLLRDHPADFEAYRQEIERWVSSRVLLGMPLKAGHPPYTFESPSVIKVRWTWEHARLISFCHVAVEYSGFANTPAEAGRGTLKVMQVDYQRGSGAALPIEQGRRKLFVTVWPVADLGWIELTGPPLHLGPMMLNPERITATPRNGVPWYHRVLQKMLNS
ncbi:MAG TPA: hypothetical protein VGZ22_21795 [Isosphaeraceae bacterium]|jgi:hypothetical protein|nr:hypothetical protein [Isosphaeraceae bacterium]